MQVISGKNKDGFISNGTIKFIFSDRLSVFDHVVGEIPNRGTSLAECTRIIFNYLNKKGISTALLSGDNNYILMEKCIPLNFEFIVRNLLTGSALHRAKNNILKLPDGMICKEFAPFPSPFVEVSTKHESKDRYNLTDHEIEKIMEESVTESSNINLKELFNEAMYLTNRIFNLLTQLFNSAGLVLLDGKIELGINKFGNLCLIDSFGPDEFRSFDKEWLNTDQKQLPDFYDKQFIRDKIKSSGENNPDGILKIHGKELVSRYQVVIKRIQQASDELCHQ